MALLRSATCIVGGDTGPLSPRYRPRPACCGAVRPHRSSRNGPYRNPCRSGTGSNASRDTDPCDADIVLRAPNSVTSHSRNDQTDPSMLAIQVDSVFNAVRRRIGAPA